MSGIYISGVEMPQEPVEFQIWPSGDVMYRDLDSGWRWLRLKDGKAISVPDHGRLGDLDALERELREEAEDLMELFPHTMTLTTWFEAYEHFADTTAVEPTIIEADGEKKR